jgi:hypothetical protein
MLDVHLADRLFVFHKKTSNSFVINSNEKGVVGRMAFLLPGYLDT